jgi:ribosomal protein S27E
VSKPKLDNFPLIHIPVKHRAVQSTGWKSTQPEKPNPEVIVARAGTVVTCPKCGATIGRLYSDLYSGVSCRADQIEFEPGQKRHANQKAECARCGEGYMKMHHWIRPGLPITIKIRLSIQLNGRQVWI